MEEVLKYLQEAKTFFVATIEGDKPKVRPFGAVTEFLGKIYLVTSNEKKVYDQMMKNPNIEICATGKDNDWMRLSCWAFRDVDAETREQVLEQLPMLKNMYSVDDGKYEIFYLQQGTATFCSFTSEPRTVTFL